MVSLVSLYFYSFIILITLFLELFSLNQNHDFQESNFWIAGATILIVATFLSLRSETCISRPFISVQANIANKCLSLLNYKMKLLAAFSSLYSLHVNVLYCMYYCVLCTTTQDGRNIIMYCDICGLSLLCFESLFSC